MFWAVSHLKIDVIYRKLIFYCHLPGKKKRREKKMLSIFATAVGITILYATWSVVSEYKNDIERIEKEKRRLRQEAADELKELEERRRRCQETAESEELSEMAQQDHDTEDVANTKKELEQVEELVQEKEHVREKKLDNVLRVKNKVSPPKAQAQKLIEEEEDEWENPIGLFPKPPVVFKMQPASKKVVYSLPEMYAFKADCQNLPAAAARENGSGWDNMDVAPANLDRDQGTSCGRDSRRPQSGQHRGGSQHRGGNGQHRVGNGQHRVDNGHRRGGAQWPRNAQVPPQQGRGGRSQGGRVQQQELCFDKPIKPLEQSENRWIATKEDGALGASVKIVQSIMNKMTREKFDTLATQLQQVPLESIDMLKAVILLIFDKALSEPHFCDLYADLCMRLNEEWKIGILVYVVKDTRDETKESFCWTSYSDAPGAVHGPYSGMSKLLEVVDATAGDSEGNRDPTSISLHQFILRGEHLVSIWSQEDGTLYWSKTLMEKTSLSGPFDSHEEARKSAINETSFRRLLLKSCQEEFQKGNVYEEIEEAIEKNKLGKTLSASEVSEMTEERGQLKQRMLGNIRFIGELYKKGMLREKIMHECIMKLLDVHLVSDEENGIYLSANHPDDGPVDEENLESLSKLLTTIGKVLDASSRLHVDQYFIQLNTLKEDKRIGIRIRFMLKDVVDLRGTRWIPRRDVLVQKTLAETRKDAEKDEALKNTGGRGGGGHRGSRNDLPSRGSRNTQGGGGFRGGDGQSNNYQRQQGRDKVNRPKPFQKHGSMSKNKPKKGLPARPSLKKSKSAGKIVAALKNVPAQVKTVVRQSLQEFIRLKDVKEVVAALNEMKQVEMDVLGYVVAVEGLTWAAEAKSPDADAIMTIVLALLKEGTVVHWKHLQYAFCILVKTGPDVKVDVPLFGSNMATFLGRMLNVKDVPLNLTWLLTGCGEGEGSESPHDWLVIAWSEFVTSGLLAEVTGRILSTSPELATCLQKDHAPLTFLFDNSSSSLEEELNTWMTKFALHELFALQKAVQKVEKE